MEKELTIVDAVIVKPAAKPRRQRIRRACRLPLAGAGSAAFLTIFCISGFACCRCGT